MRMQPVVMASRQIKGNKPLKSMKVNRTLTQAETRGAKPTFVVPVPQSQQAVPRSTTPSNPAATPPALTRRPEQCNGFTIDRFLAMADDAAKYLQRR